MKILESTFMPKKKSMRSRVKVLSAVTSMPRDELIKAVDAAISRQLEERQLSFKKVRNSRPEHSQATMSLKLDNSGRKAISSSGQL